MPSSATWQPLDVLGLALIAVPAILPIDQLESLHWYHYPGEQPLIEITLAEGETVAAYLPDQDICLEYGPGDAICTIFDSLQQDLPQQRQFWGQATPGCRPGHPHPALIRASGGAVELYCPTDQQRLRVLGPLPEAQSPV
ncbi:MAG TPA: hypothetical protein VH298_12350 [Jatrophihabitans sp.]|jgi:hypothetical protein|nr:hypothetical protein [Jatrophihabitans sp.]